MKKVYSKSCILSLIFCYIFTVSSYASELTNIVIVQEEGYWSPNTSTVELGFFIEIESSANVDSITVQCPGGTNLNFTKSPTGNTEDKSFIFEDLGLGGYLWEFEHYGFTSITDEGYLSLSTTPADTFSIVANLSSGGTETALVSAYMAGKTAPPKPLFTSPYSPNQEIFETTANATVNFTWDSTATGNANIYNIFTELGDLEEDDYLGAINAESQNITFTSDGLWEVEFFIADALQGTLPQTTTDYLVAISSWTNYKLAVGNLNALSGTISYAETAPSGSTLRINLFKDTQFTQFVNDLSFFEPQFPLNYSFDYLAADTYYLSAFLDLNNNFQWEQNEPLVNYTEQDGFTLKAIDLTSADVTGLNLTLPSSQPPQGFTVTGDVINNSGQTGPIIVLISTDSQVTDLIKQPETVDLNGIYTFSDVPAGNYYISAYLDVDNNEQYDFGTDPFTQTASPVDVQQNVTIPSLTLNAPSTLNFRDLVGNVEFIYLTDFDNAGAFKAKGFEFTLELNQQVNGIHAVSLQLISPTSGTKYLINDPSYEESGDLIIETEVWSQEFIGEIYSFNETADFSDFYSNGGTYEITLYSDLAGTEVVDSRQFTFSTSPVTGGNALATNLPVPILTPASVTALTGAPLTSLPKISWYTDLNNNQINDVAESDATEVYLDFYPEYESLYTDEAGSTFSPTEPVYPDQNNAIDPLNPQLTELPADGLWDAELIFTNYHEETDGTMTVSASIETINVYKPIISGHTAGISGAVSYSGNEPIVIQLFNQSDFSQPNAFVAEQTISGSQNRNYQFNHLPVNTIDTQTVANYYIQAFVDLNGNNQFDNMEPLTQYLEPNVQTAINLDQGDVSNADLYFPGSEPWSINVNVSDNTDLDSVTIITELATTFDFSVGLIQQSKQTAPWSFSFDNLNAETYWVRCYADQNSNSSYDTDEPFALYSPSITLDSTNNQVQIYLDLESNSHDFDEIYKVGFGRISIPYDSSDFQTFNLSLEGYPNRFISFVPPFGQPLATKPDEYYSASYQYFDDNTNGFAVGSNNYPQGTYQLNSHQYTTVDSTIKNSLSFPVGPGLVYPETRPIIDQQLSPEGFISIDFSGTLNWSPSTGSLPDNFFQIRIQVRQIVDQQETPFSWDPQNPPNWPLNSFPIYETTLPTTANSFKLPQSLQPGNNYILAIGYENGNERARRTEFDQFKPEVILANSTEYPLIINNTIDNQLLSISGSVSEYNGQAEDGPTVVELTQSEQLVAYYIINDFDQNRTYQLQNLITGDYQLTAFIDSNRNGKHDPFEASVSQSITLNNNLTNQLLTPTDPILPKLIWLPTESTVTIPGQNTRAFDAVPNMTGVGTYGESQEIYGAGSFTENFDGYAFAFTNQMPDQMDHDLPPEAYDLGTTFPPGTELSLIFELVNFGPNDDIDGFAMVADTTITPSIIVDYQQSRLSLNATVVDTVESASGDFAGVFGMLTKMDPLVQEFGWTFVTDMHFQDIRNNPLEAFSKAVGLVADGKNGITAHFKAYLPKRTLEERFGLDMSGETDATKLTAYLDLDTPDSGFSVDNSATVITNKFDVDGIAAFDEVFPVSISNSNWSEHAVIVTPGNDASVIADFIKEIEILNRQIWINSPQTIDRYEFELELLTTTQVKHVFIALNQSMESAILKKRTTDSFLWGLQIKSSLPPALLASTESFIYQIHLTLNDDSTRSLEVPFSNDGTQLLPEPQQIPEFLDLFPTYSSESPFDLRWNEATQDSMFLELFGNNRMLEYEVFETTLGITTKTGLSLESGIWNARLSFENIYETIVESIPTEVIQSTGQLAILNVETPQAIDELSNANDGDPVPTDVGETQFTGGLLPPAVTSTGGIAFSGTVTNQGDQSSVTFSDDGANGIQATLDIPAGNSTTELAMIVALGNSWYASARLQAEDSTTRTLGFSVYNTITNTTQTVGTSVTVSAAQDVKIQVINQKVYFTAITQSAEPLIETIPGHNPLFIHAIISATAGASETIAASAENIRLLQGGGLKLTLNEGWNLISVPFILNIGLTDFFKAADGTSLIEDRFWIWDGNLEQYRLIRSDELSNLQGVWVFSVASGTIQTATLSGERPEQFFDLEPGWNLFGTIHTIEQSTIPIYNGILGEIWGWNGTSYFSTSDPTNFPFWQEQNQLIEGHAYWIFYEE